MDPSLVEYLDENSILNKALFLENTANLCLDFWFTEIFR